VNYFDFFGSTCEYFLIDPIVTCMIQLALICLWGFNFKHFDSFSNSYYISFLFLFSFFFFTTSLISSTSWSYHLLCPTVLLFASSVPRQIVYLFFRTCFFFSFLKTNHIDWDFICLTTWINAQVYRERLKVLHSKITAYNERIKLLMQRGSPDLEPLEPVEC